VHVAAAAAQASGAPPPPAARPSRFELLEVHLDLGPGEQRHPPAGQHDDVVTAGGNARVVGGLAQIGGTSVRLEVRPQGLQDLLPHQSMPVGQREQLDQLGGPSAGPRGFGDGSLADSHGELPEQLDAHGRCGLQ
jgi:hypothetical protein